MGREQAKGLVPRAWGAGGAHIGLASDLGCGALEAVLGDGDDVGAYSTVEDVEVKNVGLIPAGREAVHA